MKEKTMVSFELLPFDVMICMAEAIKNNTFDLSAENLTQETRPDGIYDTLCEDAFYKKMFSDQTAFSKSIFLCFKFNSGELIKLPIALFGVSPKHKVHFPIIIGNLVTELITFKRENFSYLLNFTTAAAAEEEEDKESNSWRKLGEIKKQLIGRIFSFYQEQNSDYNAVMAWDIKDEKSLTREIAESNLFKRVEVLSLKKEVYYNKELKKKELNYINECITRWNNSKSDKLQEDKDAVITEQYMSMVSAFLNSLLS